MNLNSKVSEIMSTDLITVLEDDPVEDLKTLFNRRGIHHLLVENKAGKLQGIISTEDFSKPSFILLLEEKLVASHLMTPDPVKVSTEATLKEAVNQFLDHRFRALPVVDANNVSVGIITPYDILYKLAENA